jgi:hypothetical protein
MDRSEESTSDTAVYTINDTETIFGNLLYALKSLPENKDALDIVIRVPTVRVSRPRSIQDEYCPDTTNLRPVLENTGFEKVGESDDNTVSIWHSHVRDKSINDVGINIPRNVSVEQQFPECYPR